jgi:hypothetical protein
MQFASERRRCILSFRQERFNREGHLEERGIDGRIILKSITELVQEGFTDGPLHANEFSGSFRAGYTFTI